MFSAAELIETLRKRARVSLRPERAAGEFPPGWAQWFDTMAQRIGRITGATADAIVAVFLQRELALRPRRGAALNRWQAFATLWRQQWQPPEREDRGTRIAALVITLLVHVVLTILLLWLAYVHFVEPPPSPGEEVVQVEFVGQGTPQDQGGGPPTATPAAQAAAATRPREHTTTRSIPPPAAASQPQPPTQAPATQAPRPSTAPVVEQPLQVSAKPVPDSTFVLPPATPLVVEPAQPRVAEPRLQAPVLNVDVAPTLPAVRPLQATVPQVSVAAPTLREQPQQIQVIEPLPAIQPRRLAEHPVPTPELRQAPAAIPLIETPEPAATQAAPAAAATPSVAPASAASNSNATSTQSNPATSVPAAANGTRATATSSGRGPANTPKPGAWPTPRRGDDWGDSTRNRPGGNPGSAPGLLNADGTPRLAAGSAAAAGGGFPPGSDNWTRDQLDRAGTWLKRPPNDYTPTRFDQYWLPSGTLLEEWVRRGIREIAIPIPGTSKKIQCVISILQLGGGCGVSDPNLNDQPAVARPPPDIPFKPELQDDQGSLAKPASPR